MSSSVSTYFRSFQIALGRANHFKQTPFQNSSASDNIKRGISYETGCLQYLCRSSDTV